MTVRSLFMQHLPQSLLEKDSQIKSVPVHLTLHDRNDMNILTEKGTSGLRKQKILCMASEALDQYGLLTQEDLVVLLCSSRITIRRDIKLEGNRHQWRKESDVLEISFHFHQAIMGK